MERRVRTRVKIGTDANTNKQRQRVLFIDYVSSFRHFCQNELSKGEANYGFSRMEGNRNYCKINNIDRGVNLIKYINCNCHPNWFLLHKKDLIIFVAENYFIWQYSKWNLTWRKKKRTKRRSRIADMSVGTYVMKAWFPCLSIDQKSINLARRKYGKLSIVQEQRTTDCDWQRQFMNSSLKTFIIGVK